MALLWGDATAMAELVAGLVEGVVGGVDASAAHTELLSAAPTSRLLAIIFFINIVTPYKVILNALK